MLSALFLLFAMLLAGSYGTLPSQSASVAFQTSPERAGQGRRSAPILSSQQFVVSEARDISVSSSDDGKAKTVLASAEASLPLPQTSSKPDTPAASGCFWASASAFDARAPPHRS
ncbi:MAG: hypothetical protein KF810_12255 [Rhizobiaceae bacterium]|nr:hypothetical protein [Rhizobiaceae bacterium]